MQGLYCRACLTKRTGATMQRGARDCMASVLQSEGQSARVDQRPWKLRPKRGKQAAASLLLCMHLYQGAKIQYVAFKSFTHRHIQIHNEQVCERHFGILRDAEHLRIWPRAEQMGFEPTFRALGTGQEQVRAYTATQAVWGGI